MLTVVYIRVQIGFLQACYDLRRKWEKQMEASTSCRV